MRHDNLLVVHTVQNQVTTAMQRGERGTHRGAVESGSDGELVRRGRVTGLREMGEDRESHVLRRRVVRVPTVQRATTFSGRLSHMTNDSVSPMDTQPRRRLREAADDEALALLVSFLNTALRDHAGDPELDTLADIHAARRWAGPALTARAQRGGVELGDAFLAEQDLEPLRALRESLRDSLDANRTAPVEPPSRVTGGVVVIWSTDGGLVARPTGAGWRAIAGVLTVDLLLAQATDRLRKLKTCAYEPCGYPFVDHSPNLSRSWHDTAKCGNAVNLRAARARRRDDARP
jgi:predicted RNA-binding Zn ribbon-like protein